MAVIYSDQEIESLVWERKPLPSDWRGRTRLQPKRGHHDRKVLARFSDVCEKQFSSLAANRDRIMRFLDESLSGD